MTNASRRIVSFLILCSATVLLQPLPGRSQQDSGASNPAAQHPAVARDGSHDFDFELGTWKIHLKRRLHPLTGSNTWVEFDGTSVTRKLWNGRAQIEQFETNGAGGRVEGLTLRLYHPDSHQWYLYWANGKDGVLGQPTIGEFKDGRGEFYDQEPYNGRMIFVRFIWSNLNATPHFEQSFSDDGGKTWEKNWITDQTRVSDSAKEE
ncbi:MAG TPA: hypothetical protein VMH00_05010 [Candidatus Limnocylindrales bacterium]|nr:hypothetical protein [Candidatus Limnocylindrales bacterium]